MTSNSALETSAKLRAEMGIEDFTKQIKEYFSTLGKGELVEMIQDASYIGFDPEAVILNLSYRMKENPCCREAINICLLWLVTRGTRVRTEKANITKTMARTKSAMASLGAHDKDAKELSSDDITIGRLGALFPGWAAVIYMRVVKERGQDPFESNSYNLPHFLEFFRGAYAAHVLGYGQQHLDWSYDFDKKINARRPLTRRDIKKFHDMACNVIPAVTKLNKPAIDHLRKCKEKQSVDEIL
eukprot:GHVP01031605.1.p1 GENE.GHVP01031605.1~~GHVP01031605.1.p1  ORF type:complete len:242 (+),score=23.15 GHVP01031605.1:49-774(+)